MLKNSHETMEFTIASPTTAVTVSPALEKPPQPEPEMAGPEENFQCSQCDETFVLATSLKMHIRVRHSTSLDFDCEQCGHVFKKKSDLVRHFMSVHEGKKFKCEFCKKVLHCQRNKIQKHKDECRIKNGGPQIITLEEVQQQPAPTIPTVPAPVEKYVCATCDQVTEFQNVIVGYELIHFDCFQTFAYEVVLAMHHRIEHEGSTDFTCDGCGMLFKRKMEIVRHYTTIHEGKKFSNHGGEPEVANGGQQKPMCQLCGRSFTVLSSLTRHRKLVHGLGKEQPNAGNDVIVIDESSSSSSSNNHLVLPPQPNNEAAVTTEVTSVASITSDCGTVASFECDQCSLKFHLETSRQMHIQVVHDNVKEFKCIECNGREFGKRHDFLRHISGVHEKIRYNCNLCPTPKKFSDKSKWTTHLRSAHNVGIDDKLETTTMTPAATPASSPPFQPLSSPPAASATTIVLPKIPEDHLSHVHSETAEQIILTVMEQPEVDGGEDSISELKIDSSFTVTESPPADNDGNGNGAILGI